MPKTLCSGSYANGHLLRSVDGGVVWDDVFSTTGPEIYGIVGIATDGAGVWCFSIEDLYTDQGKIYRSDDDGLTWTLVYTAAEKHCIWSIATDTAGTWFAVTNNTYGATVESLILKSTDNGENWVVNYSTGHVDPHHNMFSIAYGGGEVWCIGGDKRIYRTANNGTSWAVVHTFAGYEDAWSIASNGAGVWCAGINLWEDSNGSIYRSADDGVTWTEAYVTGDWQVDTLATDGDGNWCAVSTYLHGYIYRSINEGVDWTQVYDIRTALGVNPAVDVYITGMAQDDAGNWVVVGADDVGAVAIGSSDSGATWAPLYESAVLANTLWCIAFGGALCPAPEINVGDVDFV